MLGNWIKCSGKNFKRAWIMYMYIVSMFTFQTSQVQIQQQIVIQPSYPKSMKNKSIMCKPFLQTKATSCKPHTQTLGIQTGSTNSLILDCRLCLHIHCNCLISMSRDTQKQTSRLHPRNSNRYNKQFDTWMQSWYYSVNTSHSF